MNNSLYMFKKRMNLLNLSISDDQIGKFDKYYEMLVEKNKVMNLTAITEYEDVLLKHFIDSVSVNVVDAFTDIVNKSLKSEIKVIDVGTGAGFPGIPLKIMFPSFKIDLLDSLNKRINYLIDVIDSLELKDINAFHGRAEDVAKNPIYREKYDLCVSRAVANLSTLSEYCLPFLKIDGCFIALKSGDIEEELNNSKKAIKILGGKIEKVVPFVLPESDIERSFVVIKKIEKTSSKYPRKAGLPSKEPL